MVRVPLPGRAAPSCFLLSHEYTAFFFRPQKGVFLGWVNLSSQQVWSGLLREEIKPFRPSHKAIHQQQERDRSVLILNGSVSLEREKGSHDTKKRSEMW